MVNWSIATSMKFLFFILSQADSAWSVFWTVPYRFGPVSLIDGGITRAILIRLLSVLKTEWSTRYQIY